MARVNGIRRSRARILGGRRVQADRSELFGHFRETEVQIVGLCALKSCEDRRTDEHEDKRCGNQQIVHGQASCRTNPLDAESQPHMEKNLKQSDKFRNNKDLFRTNESDT
jgi:hypothetical protein